MSTLKTDDSSEHELVALYRATRDQAPSTSIDATILSHARPAARRRRYRRWAPLSGAAVLLLGLSLTLQIVDLEGPADTAAPAPQRSTVPAAPAAPQTVTRPAPAAAAAAAAKAIGSAARDEKLSFDAPEMAMPMIDGRKRVPLSTTTNDAQTPADADPAWELARIRQLIQRGDRENAKIALGEFRKRYPHYPIPQDVATLH